MGTVVSKRRNSEVSESAAVKIRYLFTRRDDSLRWYYLELSLLFKATVKTIQVIKKVTIVVAFVIILSQLSHE